MGGGNYHYIHTLPGRLRVKVPQIKRNAAKAASLRTTMMGLPGVRDASANPTTGNLLVIFDGEAASHDTILAAIAEAGYLDPGLVPLEQRNPVRRGDLLEGAASYLLQVALKVVIEQAVARLF